MMTVPRLTHDRVEMEQSLPHRLTYLYCDGGWSTECLHRHEQELRGIAGLVYLAKMISLSVSDTKRSNNNPVLFNGLILTGNL